MGGFLDLFGRPQRDSACECERRSDVSLSQALNLINGQNISEAVADPKGRVARLLQTKPDDRKIVEEVYLAALCRPPRADELPVLRTYAEKHGLANLCRMVLNSNEFIFVN